MAQMESRGAERQVGTVADLVNRIAPVPVRSPRDGNRVGAVRSLLRRKGRAPRATPQPWPAAPVKAPAPVLPGRTLRRGAIAAVFLTTGSAFGAAVLSDASLSSPLDPGTGADPGRGVLDPAGRAPEAPPVTVIDPAAASADALDAGAPLPSSWMGVGFPAAPAAGSDVANGTPGAAVGTAGPGADAPAADGDPAGATGASSPQASSAPPPATTGPGTNAPTGNGATPSGNVPKPARRAQPGPGAGPVQALTETVTGSPVNTAAEPVITVVAPAPDDLVGAVTGLLGS